MSRKRPAKIEGEFEGEIVILSLPFVPIFCVCKIPGYEVPLITREVEPLHRGDLKTYEGVTYRCLGKSSALVPKGKREQDFKPTYHFEQI